MSFSLLDKILNSTFWTGWHFLNKCHVIRIEIHAFTCHVLGDYGHIEKSGQGISDKKEEPDSKDLVIDVFKKICMMKGVIWHLDKKNRSKKKDKKCEWCPDHERRPRGYRSLLARWISTKRARVYTGGSGLSPGIFFIRMRSNCSIISSGVSCRNGQKHVHAVI